MNQNKWQIFSDFSYDPSDQEEVEARLAVDDYQSCKVLGSAIVLMQLVMLLLFLTKPGGLFATPRRTGYVVLYLLLLGATLIFLYLKKRFKNHKGRVQLQQDAAYAAFVCLWANGITLLDQYGGNGLIVYSYTLPACAALIVLNMRQSVTIFGSAFIFLNLFLPSTPDGVHNMFSNLVNSTFIMLLSFLIARQVYCARTSAHYNNIIVERQYRVITENNIQLNQLATVDQLTGLHNRRFLEGEIQRRLNSLIDKDCAVTGMMLDIDYFKRYNDQYGHIAGDNCLRAISHEISHFIGSDEHLYGIRYGGEEFFLCWLGCDAQQAMAGAEQLRKAIAESIEVQEDSLDGKVTVSIGVYSQHLWMSQGLEEFVRRADLALYAAKAQGRDCCVLYRPEMHFCQVTDRNASALSI